MLEQIEVHFVCPFSVGFGSLAQVTLKFVRNHISKSVLLYFFSGIQFLDKLTKVFFRVGSSFSLQALISVVSQRAVNTLIFQGVIQLRVIISLRIVKCRNSIQFRVLFEILIISVFFMQRLLPINSIVVLKRFGWMISIRNVWRLQTMSILYDLILGFVLSTFFLLFETFSRINFRLSKIFDLSAQNILVSGFGQVSGYGTEITITTLQSHFNLLIIYFSKIMLLLHLLHLDSLKFLRSGFLSLPIQ